MKRFSARDHLLLAVLLPVWLVCLAFHVKEILRTGFAEPPIYAAPAVSHDGYPTVGGFRWERGQGGEALAVGDRLIRIGSRDLQGVGYLGFDAIALEEAGTSLRAALVFEREGTQRTLELQMLSSRFAWHRVIPVVSWVLVSLLVLLRAPGAASRRLLAAALAVGILGTPFFGGSFAQGIAALVVFNASGGIAYALALRWAIHFPDEVPERARLSPRWAWLGMLWYVVRVPYFVPGIIASDAVPTLTVALDGLFMLGALAIVTWNYAHADPIGRRRVKWVVLSGFLGIAPLGFTALAASLAPEGASFAPAFEVGVLLFALVPIGLLVAILRYNLYDVDRLISATASYSALGIALLAAALTLLPRVAQAASRALGIEDATGHTLLSLLLALAVVPAQRRVRPQIERVFFRERHAIEEGIEDLLRDLSQCDSPAALGELAGERLDALLQPESFALYVRRGELFEPAFVRGRAVPPAFSAMSPLVAALRGRRRPLTAETFVASRRSVELDPFDRAALETLGVPVVLPVHRGKALVAFFCLGPRRSGDVYTSTDITLLTAVSDKISGELLRFDLDQMLAAGQAMQDSLRRYVPGAVAEQIEAGRDLTSRECQVSVLFVDLRRYSSYAEGRPPEEIFSTVNRYTDAVSRVVSSKGGSVVEFSGDGMMAVFGAPVSLHEKEKRALDAAREIVDAVAALGGKSGTTTLSVGVGIATGSAFVGNIRAVDRMIWSVIGNTTNLAARLQQMTRDLDAAIVVDAATWDASETRDPSWVYHARTCIRGRSEPVDVWAQPLNVGRPPELAA